MYKNTKIQKYKYIFVFLYFCIFVFLCLKGVCVYMTFYNTQTHLFWGVSLCSHAWAIVICSLSDSSRTGEPPDACCGFRCSFRSPICPKAGLTGDKFSSVTWHGSKGNDYPLWTDEGWTAVVWSHVSATRSTCFIHIVYCLGCSRQSLINYIDPLPGKHRSVRVDLLWNNKNNNGGIILLLPLASSGQWSLAHC